MFHSITLANAREHGEATASGKIGTGWMGVEGLVDEAIREIGITRYPLTEDQLEALDEYVQKWSQTNQWEYEVSSHFALPQGNEAVAIDAYLDVENAWFAGYTDVLLQAIEKHFQT